MFKGYDGKSYQIGDRVEISPNTDLWMQGARYGVAVGASLTSKDRIHVKLDHIPHRIFAGTEDTFRKVE